MGVMECHGQKWQQVPNKWLFSLVKQEYQVTRAQIGCRCCGPMSRVPIWHNV